MNDAWLKGDHTSNHFGKHNNQTENKVQQRWWWVLCGLKSHLYQTANEGLCQCESLGKNDLHIRMERKFCVICLAFRGFVEKNRR